MPNSTWTWSICSGVAPSISSFIASTWRGISMRLPMKPWQTPATTATFLIFLASAITVASTSWRGLGAAHDFEQLHDIGGREEVHAEHVLRAALVLAAISLMSR